jgi:hypothetical protein
MKKIYVVTLMLLVSVMAMGQQMLPASMIKVYGAVKMTNKVIPPPANNHFKIDREKGNDRWYNYGEAMDVLLSGIGELSANYLFPDSTMLVNYSGGIVAGTWIHKLGDVFNPAAANFNDAGYFGGELQLNKNSTYTLDSIQILGFYLRGVNTPSATDTLLVEVAANAPATYTYTLDPDICNNLNTDTVKWYTIPYTQSSNSFAVNPHSHFKIPLNAAVANDTLSNGMNLFSIAVNLPVGANQVVFTSVSFIPGYTWTPNADSMSQHNSFRFISMNENPSGFPMYTDNDWNASYIIEDDVRYNTGGLSWNGKYIPSWAYMWGTTNTYGYVHHSIYYKCTGLTNFGSVSVEEHSAEGIALGNAFPNPVNVGTELSIPVNSNEPSVLIVSDIFGKEIATYSQINSNMVSISTSELSAGVYLYTLVSGENATTKRFVVVE